MADQQKVKIREFRDETNKLQDNVENLELDKKVKKFESSKRSMEKKMK